MKNFVVNAIWGLAFIMIIAGFFMGLAGWSQSITKSYRASDFMPMAIIGTVMFLNSFFMMGVAYIVEAAILYIEKNKKKEVIK